jgi:hypothetical protein
LSPENIEPAQHVDRMVKRAKALEEAEIAKARAKKNETKYNLATQMSHLSRPPRGQQRDKPYREALRMELAAAGDNMKKLREIARVHIARCEAGDMQAIKELANRQRGDTG